jgi:enamine deaminase RidA (YjgF/YER057c/UK114 family)
MQLTETEVKLKIKQNTSTWFLFSPEEGTREAHILLQSPPGLNTADSWRSVIGELEKTEEELGFPKESRLFLRVFMSDALNQEKILREKYPEYFDYSKRISISLVQQPPMPDSKLAVWAYLVDGNNKVQSTDFGNIFPSNGLTHIWTANLMGDALFNTFGQTEGMFVKYIQNLEQLDSNLFDNAIRTWIFVRDVDVMYNDVVEARKLIFEEQNLTESTHYIASTGIEGRNEHPSCFAFMDTYSIGGVKPEQVQYINAPNHLCRTSKYGVTFERGVSIQYGDRRHVFISGTASIDNKGEILFPESVEKQTERVIENTEALLISASCKLSDVAMALVYLRDLADYEVVKKIIDEMIPGIPCLILIAPVCRPAWLVEMEVIAVSDEFSKWNDY